MRALKPAQGEPGSRLPPVQYLEEISRKQESRLSSSIFWAAIHSLHVLELKIVPEAISRAVYVALEPKLRISRGNGVRHHKYFDMAQVFWSPRKGGGKPSTRHSSPCTKPVYDGVEGSSA